MGVGSIIKNIINTRKGVNITNGMTLGGEKQATMLRKGYGCWVYYMKHNQ
jgi:hypothetical protein